jgi:hypothetical protein
VQAGASSAPPDDAKTDNFFFSLRAWQWGHGVPSQRVERTSTSLSFPQLSQWNS